MSMWILFIVTLSTLLFLVNLLFFSLEWKSEGLHPFECGIDPLSEVKTPFYMHFFFISVLFLIFDIELAITLPLISSSLSEETWNLFWYLFILILFLGLGWEILIGTLSWKE